MAALCGTELCLHFLLGHSEVESVVRPAGSAPVTDVYQSGLSMTVLASSGIVEGMGSIYIGCMYTEFAT